MQTAHTLYSSEASLVEILPNIDLLIGAVLVPGARAPKLFCDNNRGGYLAGCHLAEHGHRRVLFVGGAHNRRMQARMISLFLPSAAWFDAGGKKVFTK
jgi:hypothetical protein